MKPSPIRACFVATQEADTFTLRGMQIAGTRQDWAALVNPPRAQLAAFDVIVVVKRFDARLAGELRAAGKPVVFDALDPWQSPGDDILMDSRDAALHLLNNRIRALDPDAVICPTEAMLIDLPSICTLPAAHIPFHAQPGLPKNEIRERVTKLGYEGEAQLLGDWHGVFHQIAGQLGGHFLINPVSPADVDILISARAKTVQSYMTTRWKADLKPATAIASGTPGLFVDEANARETAGPAAEYFSTVIDLQNALGVMQSQAERKRMAEAGLGRAAMFSLDAIADRYDAFLQTVKPTQQHMAPMEFTILPNDDGADE